MAEQSFDCMYCLGPIL